MKNSKTVNKHIGSSGDMRPEKKECKHEHFSKHCNSCGIDMLKEREEEQRGEIIAKIKDFPTFKTMTAGGEREIILKEDLLDEL